MIKLQQLSTGLLSALMACTGGAIMIITAAKQLDLSSAALLSWMFIVYVAGGAMNLWLALAYKIPFAGAHSITAAAFLSMTAVHLSLAELAGGYILAGAIIALLGVTGIFHKLLQLIPRALIDAMLAGLILHYVTGIVPVFQEAPFIAGLSLIGYFVAPRLSKSIPPLLGVLVFGLIGLMIVYPFPAMVSIPFSLPQPIIPAFTFNGLLTIAIPLAVLVLTNDLAVALAALMKNGYRAPSNKAVALSGFGTIMSGIFGGQAINIGGMMTALCSSDEAGHHDERYKAAVVSSIIVILFGLFSWKLIAVIELLPSYFITMLTGFSLAGVLLGSLQSAFQDTRYKYAALFSFVIAVSGISFFGISAAVWSLVAGSAAAKLLGEGGRPLGTNKR
ncbi:benzoate/H(+) symporter BenE family transporter [Paenibacillus sp. NPDC058071]|uniref:benzoate/H(+) symporter BenE family transporter n=1 Tax=Paenibacillus sp. NPDC058071 TaxID=3346326 RepID=UPI0036DA9F17